MLLRNLQPTKGLANGSSGWLHSLTSGQRLKTVSVARASMQNGHQPLTQVDPTSDEEVEAELLEVSASARSKLN